MFCDDVLGVCVDIGHKKTAIGYIGDDAPRYSTSSFAGTRSNQGGMDIEVENGAAVNMNQLIFGENLTCRSEGMKYHHILENEKIVDINQYQGFLSFLLNRCRLNTRECALLVSEQNSNQNHNDREAVAKLAFEEFEVPAFFSIKKSILSLFANGRTTGLVLETGANLTQLVPISEGYTLYKALMSAPVGGDTVTWNIASYLEDSRGKQLLPPHCYNFSIDAEGAKIAEIKDYRNMDPSALHFHKMRYVQEMKEMLFKVSTPSDESTSDIMTYELPDGSSVSFGANRYSFAEIFFSDNPVG